MKAKGAVYAEAQGWERPGWFAPEGVTPKYDYSFHRPSWFDHAQAEQKAARTGVAMIDYSMLGKLMVEGPDAMRFLQRICTNEIDVPVGRVAYTLMLNERGGIESDVTVARHGADSFMVMSLEADMKLEHCSFLCKGSHASEVMNCLCALTVLPLRNSQ